MARLSRVELAHSVRGLRTGAFAASLECVQRCSDLFDRRPLAIVRLDPDPAYVSFLIEDENRRTRNAVELLVRVFGVAQAITIDRMRLTIRQHRESQRSPAIRLDLLREILTLFGPVAADRVEAHLGEAAREITESD